MATRYRTYQYDWGFLTIDTQNETAPEGYTAEFQVNMEEAEQIEQGADIQIINDEAVVIPQEEV
jgi:hypothetical protein